MRCDVPGAWCGARGAWYEVRGARYEAQDTWYVVHLLGLSGGHMQRQKYVMYLI